MRVLFLDVETSPNTVRTFDLWNAFISQDRILEPSRLLCWAASWLDEDRIMFDSEFQSSRKEMLKGIYNLINEADVVVTYNGDKFDMKVLNSEFLLNDMPPPKPVDTVDMYKVVKKRFKMPSNKLAYIVKALGLGEKPGEGYEIWDQCLAGSKEAWSKMKRYNINDVVVLKALYKTLLGWIPRHPNQGLYVESDNVICTNCGSDDLEKRGFRRTRARLYQRYCCNKCGAWSSSRLSEEGISSKVVP